MMKQIIDKYKFGPWALVTGASAGIGEGFGKHLAANGLNLVLVARRKDLLEELGKSLARKYKIQILIIEADLGKEEAIQQIIDATNDLEIGLLVSNAGTGSVGKFFERTEEELKERIQLNATSHLSLTHYFGKKMAERKRGGVLLTGAMGAVEGLPYMSNEAGTKGYIQALGKSLHSEFKEYGIHITVLVTTPTETSVFYKLGFSMQNTPMRPIGVPQCVAESLHALVNNQMLVYPGLKFRIMRALTPESMAREMTGRMLKKNNNIR